MAETVGVLKVRIDAEAGEGLEALARLERENARLRQALTDVCSPMQMFLRGIPPEQRRYVDSGIMVRLCDSVSFIQEIARKALEEQSELATDDPDASVVTAQIR